MPWIFIPDIWSILYGNFCHQLKSPKSFSFQHQLQFSFCIHNMWPELHLIWFIIRSFKIEITFILDGLKYNTTDIGMSGPNSISVALRSMIWNRMIYLLLITIVANIITIMLVNFFRIHLDRTLKYPLNRTCSFNWAGQTYPRAFEASKMKKVFVDFKSKSNYSSLASMTFFHQFVLKANWAHVSMVWSANGMKMILYLIFFYFFYLFHHKFLYNFFLYDMNLMF